MLFIRNIYTYTFNHILCKKYNYLLFRRLLDRVPLHNIIQSWLQLFTGTPFTLQYVIVYNIVLIFN